MVYRYIYLHLEQDKSFDPVTHIPQNSTEPVPDAIIHSVLYNCACFIKNIVAIAPCIKNFFYRVSQFLQS